MESVKEKEWKVIRNLILSYSYLVDEALLQEVLLNVDRDIALVLIHIHERSVEIGSNILFEGGSIKEE